MITITKTKSVFSLEQIVTIIEYAFHQADELCRFENNCVFAVKKEIGQVIIKPKISFCYDPFLIKRYLLERFPPDKYILETTYSIVIITKNIGIGSSKTCCFITGFFFIDFFNKIINIRYYIFSNMLFYRLWKNQ